MKNLLASMIATLLILLPGAVSAQTADNESTGGETAAPQTPAANTEPVPAVTTETDKASAADTAAEPVSGADETAAPKTPPAKAKSVPAATTETEKAPVANKAPEPITGAFGIPLGARFEPSMVAKVLGEQEQTYRGADGTERKGFLIRVEPSEPDQRFQRYALKTTNDGIIYAIQGDYQLELEQEDMKLDKAQRSKTVRSTCKTAVKALAKELEARYGKVRGKGWDGEWFVFRQTSDKSDMRLRLYGNRCRTGMYSIIYTDDKINGKQ